MTSAELAVDDLLDFPTVDVTLNYLANRERYRHDLYESTDRILGNAQGVWLITPHNLTFRFSNDRDELELDSLGRDTPDNRVTRSTLRFGPEYAVRLSSPSSLQFSANFVSNTFDRSGPIESDTTVMSAAWVRGLSRLSNVRFNVQRVVSEFDPLPIDSETNRLSVGLNTSTRRATFSLEAGKDLIDRGMREGIDGFFVSLNASYETRTGTYRIEAVKQLTDSAIGLSINGGADAGPELPSGDRNFTVGDIVDRTRVALTVDQATANPRLSWGMTIAWDRQDFEVEPNDESTFTAGLNFNYWWRPRTTFNLTYELNRTRRTALALAGEEEDVQLGLRMNRTINARANISAYMTRRNAEFELRGGAYDESIAGLRVDYRI